MIKKACICLLFCFLFGYQVNAEAPVVKVGLFYGATAKSAITLTVDGQTVTYRAEELEQPVTITADTPIGIEGVTYRGSILLQKNGDGNLTVINQVGMDDYIASLLGKEMSPSFHIEALKAQAVCARTYALRHIGKHAESGFDVCPTQHCQVYGGTKSEYDVTIRAARETAGQVLQYQGKLAETVYFATSGGYTEDAENVWGGTHAYLKAVQDKYEDPTCYGASWEKVYTPAQLTERLASTGIGNVVDIKILEQTPRGVVTKVKVLGDAGEIVYNREQCRTALGLLSQAFTVKTPVAATTPAQQDVQINVGGQLLAPRSMYVLSANGKVAVFEGQTLSLLGSTTHQVVVAPPAPPQPENPNFVFNGRGWGHLVGMSQNGANGMAKAGFSYQQILQHYYQGTNLQSL